MITLSTCTSRHTAGFTLIELLIVVAIVAILSAIAVPNFLEAQTRAKVSRSRADLKAIATGLETYRTDYRGYPVVGNLQFPGSWDMYVPYAKRLNAITTPIAYISTIPNDVFYSSEKDEHALGPQYCYAPGNLYHGASPKYKGNIYRSTIYSVSGRGPDREINAGGYCMAHPEAFETGMNVRGAYDPTNGTVSQGDLIQLSCTRM